MCYQAYFGSHDFSFNIPDLHPNNMLIQSKYLPVCSLIFLSLAIEKNQNGKNKRTRIGRWDDECEEIAHNSWVHVTYLDTG